MIWPHIFCIFIFQWVIVAASRCTPAIVSNYYISNNVLTAEESTTVNIAMKFENSSCFKSNTVLLTVESFDLQSKLYELRCKYLYITSTCSPQTNKKDISCLCGRNEFSMIKRLERSDNTHWKWTTLWSDKSNDSIIIWINVTHPAILVNLTINGHSGRSLLKQNESVYIICEWENSNPPTTARLMKNNQTLAEQSKSGNITYILPVVRCSDASTIECMTGEEDNLTVFLLVECPPEFVSPSTEIHSLLDEHMFHIEIPVRSHTTQIIQCQITRLIESSSTSSSVAKEVNILERQVIDCSAANDHSRGQCFCSLTGTPPDLIFTMCLQNVTEEYYGVWQAHITNGIGTGQVSLSVQDKPIQGFKAPPDSKGANVSIPLGITALICAAIAIIISCVKIKLKKGQVIQTTLHDYDEVDSLSTMMVQTCTNANGGPEGRVSNTSSAPFPVLNLGSTLPDLDYGETYSRLQMK